VWFRPPAPVDGPAVVAHPPSSAPAAGRDPQASLLQPEPAPEAARSVTVARWPLGAPADQAAPDGATWSRPLPLEPPPAPSAAGAVRPMPALAAAPRARTPARTRPRPLTGTHPCRLDEDGSLVLPEALRRQLDEPGCRTLFVVPGPEEVLWLFTGTALEKWAAQFDESAAGAARARSARRLCLAQTEACTVDRAGRVRLPERLARYAGLRQDVVLIGVGDHLELWDGPRWLRMTR
jgi:MraZ protein